MTMKSISPDPTSRIVIIREQEIGTKRLRSFAIALCYPEFGEVEVIRPARTP
jgi:hypothetical protein